MHLGISPPPVPSFRFLALSRFPNPFPNPPSLSQLSRTSVSRQISRFDQELIYKVLLPLTTLEGWGGCCFGDPYYWCGGPRWTEARWNVLEIGITDTGFSTSRRLPRFRCSTTLQNLWGFRGEIVPIFFVLRGNLENGLYCFSGFLKVFVTSGQRNTPKPPGGILKKGCCPFNWLYEGRSWSFMVKNISPSLLDQWHTTNNKGQSWKTRWKKIAAK